MTRTNSLFLSARVVAAEALDKYERAMKGSRGEPTGSYAGDILAGLLSKTDQRQRATDLVFGTLRNRLAIDRVLAMIAETPRRRISQRLINILRVALYELIYRPETPVYSIINEAVENVKSAAAQKQANFVNAILRKVETHIEQRQIPRTLAVRKRALPQDRDSACLFDKCLLPDAEQQAADHLSLAFSLPRWLVAEWIDRYGRDDAEQVCFASNRRPSVYLRPNSLRATAGELADRLGQAGLEQQMTPDGTMLKLQRPKSPFLLPGFAEGMFAIQDPTATKVVAALDPQPDWAILDLCAAPGTKTTQLAEHTADSAKIFATDIDPDRLEKVGENIERLRLTSINTFAYEDLQKLCSDNGLFDAILLDVPCSNTGVLARRAEVRYRIDSSAIERLVHTQTELLDAAAQVARPGGRIAYSTCSIHSAENETLIELFLSRHTEFTLELQQLTLPSCDDFDHDGGYYAILHRKQDTL